MEKEAFELLDALTAALETCMAHYGPMMPEADQAARERLIYLSKQLLRTKKGQVRYGS